MRFTSNVDSHGMDRPDGPEKTSVASSIRLEAIRYELRHKLPTSCIFQTENIVIPKVRVNLPCSILWFVAILFISAKDLCELTAQRSAKSQNILLSKF